MSLKEYIESKKEINEGLKYFKQSEKLIKLAKKMEYQVLMHITNEDQRDEIRDYIITIKKATKDFEAAEKEYAIGDKDEAKKMYKKLKAEYETELSRVDKPLLNIFKQYGASLLYFTAIQIFGMFLFPQIGGLIKGKK